jgi:hypothetical protein
MINQKKRFISSFAVLLFSTGCVLPANENQKTQSDQSKKEEEEIVDKRAMESYPKFENIEDLMEYKLTRNQSSYKNQEVIKNILKQKHKFRYLAQACVTKNSPKNRELLFVRGDFYEPIKLDDQRYIIELICGNHRVMSSFVFFFYTHSEGIQIKPLEFTVLDVGEYGQIYEEKTKILLGFPSYDATTQELTIKKICDYTGGHRSTLGKYKLENNDFEMVEFWLDTEKHTKCISPPPLERLYPQ